MSLKLIQTDFFATDDGLYTIPSEYFELNSESDLANFLVGKSISYLSVQHLETKLTRGAISTSLSVSIMIRINRYITYNYSKLTPDDLFTLLKSGSERFNNIYDHILKKWPKRDDLWKKFLTLAAELKVNIDHCMLHIDNTLVDIKDLLNDGSIHNSFIVRDYNPSDSSNIPYCKCVFRAVINSHLCEN